VSGHILVSAVAVGLPSLAYCAPDMVAMLRARREDLPALMKARAKRPGDDDTCTRQVRSRSRVESDGSSGEQRRAGRPNRG
jgi:hypothetical protein